MKEKNLKKPDWIRVKHADNVQSRKVKSLLHAGHHVTVCDEALCPNRAECFARGTATFMIMGDICTRRCDFCNVKHGKPDALNLKEPDVLANTIADMKLKYVVITSVDRDDLDDGGAKHYVECIKAIRKYNPSIKIEVLTPDFQRCMENALDVFSECLPDVFSHNVETVPSLYKSICPGCDYLKSLKLLQTFKQRFPEIPTKSGMMLGLGETDDEIIAVLDDLRDHQVDLLTLGQYLQPSKNHAPVRRYLTPEEFNEFKKQAELMGFSSVMSGPMVRSSYYADKMFDL